MTQPHMQYGVLFETFEEFDAYVTLGMLAADLHNLKEVPLKDITSALITLAARWSYIQARMKPTIPGKCPHKETLDNAILKLRASYVEAQEDTAIKPILPN